MRYLIGVTLLALVACSPGRGYIAADRMTYDAIAPDFTTYVASDAALDSDQKERRLKAVESWKARLEQAESTEQGE